MTTQKPKPPNVGTDSDTFNFNDNLRVNRSTSNTNRDDDEEEVRRLEDVQPVDNIAENDSATQTTETTTQPSNNLILTTIISDTNTEAQTKEDWIRLLSVRIPNRLKRMPNGGWKNIM